LFEQYIAHIPIPLGVLIYAVLRLSDMRVRLDDRAVLSLPFVQPSDRLDVQINDGERRLNASVELVRSRNANDAGAVFERAREELSKAVVSQIAHVRSPLIWSR